LADNVTLTQEDAIFFLDMIRSYRSPNHIPQLKVVKPYHKIVRNNILIEHQLFIRVYKEVRHILSEKEAYILDEVYNNGATLKIVGKSLNISSERVRQIRTFAEFKIGKEVADRYSIKRV